MRTPSFSISPRQRSLAYPSDSTPLSKSVGFSEMRYKNVCSSVIVLLKPCSPSAIVRAVSFVVINSVNREASRTLSHIGKEAVKRTPLIAYRYASTAIVRIVCGIRVFASSFHIHIRLIRSGFFSPYSVTMSNRPLSDKTSTITPARFSSPRLKIRKAHSTFVSAVASANTRLATIFKFSALNHSKFVVFHAANYITGVTAAPQLKG